MAALHLCTAVENRKLEVLEGIIMEENVNKFMRLVGPSGVRALQMYTGALDIRKQRV